MKSDHWLGGHRLRKVNRCENQVVLIQVSFSSMMSSAKMEGIQEEVLKSVGRKKRGEMIILEKWETEFTKKIW